jgi:Tfp pilus assembly protein PilF
MSAAEGRKPYYQAALFYYDHGQDLQKASKWIDAAIADRETYYIVHLKAKILAKLGDKEGAIVAAKHSTELAIKAKDTGYVKLNEDLISSLK